MHLARLAGLDHEADRGAQALADQVMMHGRAGEQRRDRDALGAGAAVRQDDDVDAVAHGRFGARAQRVERVLQAGGAVLGRPGGVEEARLEMAVADLRDRADLFQVLVGEDRLAHFEPLGAATTPSRSNRFGRGPMIETRLITSSSRIGSIGGFVTCAKFCLK